MFGNLQGWIISAVMLLATVGMLVIMAQPPKESAWRNAVPLAFKPIGLPVPAETVQPLPTGDCNAAEFYKDAIARYLDDPKPYHEAARTDISSLPAVEQIVKGANCSRMHLFDTDFAQAVGYGKKPWIEAVAALGQATNDAGLRLRGSHPDEALKYYQAAFEFGRKLFEERVTWDEASKGLSIMTASAEAMTKLADMKKDGARVDQLQKFAQQVNQYHTDLQDKVASPLGNPIESYGAQYAGDVFAVAKNPSLERAWRIEAILHLGHYRWNVADGNKGDQIWAPRELDALDKGASDPAVKAAAQAAQNLTLDQQRLTAGG